MTWLLQLFTWWNGQTLNTRFYTWRTGEFVGEDIFGNKYYRTKGGKINEALGFERRWVIYRGVSEGSETPPGWFGWLHHLTNIPPTQEDYRKHPWELPYVPNMSGTPLAYVPPGSTLSISQRAPSTGDYEAWSP